MARRRSGKRTRYAQALVLQMRQLLFRLFRGSRRGVRVERPMTASISLGTDTQQKNAASRRTLQAGQLER